MINALRRLNEALPMLLLGILIWGVLIQVTGVWFVDDKIRYSSGLWIGIGCAVFMAIHLGMVIEEAVRTQPESTKLLSAKSVVRYLVVCVVFFAMMYFELGNLLTAFIGVMGLKVSAYAQPLLHKLICGKWPSEEDDPVEEVQEEITTAKEEEVSM